jgi:hypothetical protein
MSTSIRQMLSASLPTLQHMRWRAQNRSPLGQDEKQAFTTVVGISAASNALLFQIIYSGKTKHSLPTMTSAQHQEAQQLRFQFCYSNTDTYWSTFDLMCSYVSDILVPYWMHQKEFLGAPPDQECLLQLDIWSVHRSIAFQTWLNETYPWIKYCFIPGNCTGIAQPCDVGVQHPFKLVVKCSQHTDIVNYWCISMWQCNMAQRSIMQEFKPLLQRLSFVPSSLSSFFHDWG